jgi:Oxidoreductase NAD-binding domain
MDVTLLHPPDTDAEGNIRTFSIASAPFEDHLMVTTRMRDTAFKRSLKTVPLGTEVKVENPGGSLTLHKNSFKPGVFLAGGIGITPFLSILSQATHDKLPHQLYLFYANRRPEDAPFLDKLDELQTANPNFRFIPTMTGMEKSHQQWAGRLARSTEPCSPELSPGCKVPSITSPDRPQWSSPYVRCSSPRRSMKTTSAPKSSPDTDKKLPQLLRHRLQKRNRHLITRRRNPMLPP